MATDGKPEVHPILGTMTFGAEAQVRPAEAGQLLRAFAGAACAQRAPRGCALVDTARVYQQATPDGDTETTLGGIFAASPSLASRTSVATKANPMMPPHFSLSRQSIMEQCHTSLEKLGLDCVDLFYLHTPDIKTDIEDTLSGVEQLHKEGKIKEFGLSNYPAWAVVDIWYRCKSRGMVLPTVYQGMYNVITRGIEPEIVPVARQFGLRLYMYNPVAGGLLTGRYSRVEDLAEATEGRFSAEFDRAFGDKFKAGTVLYRARYSKRPLFDAIRIIQDAIAAGVGAGPATGDAGGDVVVQEAVQVIGGAKVYVRIEETQTPARPQAQGLDLCSVALRWLIHHSLLGPGDGVILGVSKQAHLVANLAAWQGGPLPPAILEACNAAWEVAASASEPYFRGYGAKPGGVELFLKAKAEERQRQEEQQLAAKKARVE